MFEEPGFPVVTNSIYLQDMKIKNHIIGAILFVSFNICDERFFILHNVST